MHGTATRPRELTILDIQDPGWAAFVAGHPDATPFHHPSWAQLLADCYRLRARVAAMFDDSGAIVAGVPIIEAGRAARRRWISLPFTDRCAPLVRASSTDELLEHVEHTRRTLGLHSIELRDRAAAPGTRTVPRGHWHELRLASGPDELYAGFHKLRVRLIKRAQREGVVVERASSKRDLCEGFYRLHVATRKRLGVPVQPRRFFELLWERMLARNLGFVVTARKGTAPIASAVFLSGNGRVTYKFSASDNRYARLGGTSAVIWEAIRSAHRDGYVALDFGRTEQGNAGLRAFKLGWGAREEPLEYTLLGPGPPAADGGRAHAALATVIRRSPGWVARAVGTMAYRYTA